MYVYIYIIRMYTYIHISVFSNFQAAILHMIKPVLASNGFKPYVHVLSFCCWFAVVFSFRFNSTICHLHQHACWSNLDVCWPRSSHSMSLKPKTGGWATPLKNDGLRQLRDDDRHKPNIFLGK